MHKASEEKRSGESASSHPESIACLNKGSPRSQLWNAVSLFQGFSFALRVAPGAENPTLQPLCWQRARLPPLFNFGCLRMECTPWGAFIEKRPGAKFLGGFFRLRGREAGELSNTCTHADQRRKRGRVFPSLRHTRSSWWARIEDNREEEARKRSSHWDYKWY